MPFVGDETPKSVSQIYCITERRVRQLVQDYRETGEVPTLNPNRRPRTYLTDEQKHIVDEVWEEVRLGAGLLYYEPRRRGHNIPHNKINKYLCETGRIIPNPKKQKKRKRCRYERKHGGKFESDPEFMDWYNDRLHGALKLEWAETPNEAFIRKLRPETHLGLFFENVVIV